MNTVPFPNAREGGAAEPTGGLILLARLIAADLRRPTFSLDEPGECEGNDGKAIGDGDDAKVVPLRPRRRRRKPRIHCLLVAAQVQARSSR